MKKRGIKIIELAIVFALSLAAFVICGCEPKQVELKAPTNLQISGTVLTWDKVESANGYMVIVDGVEKKMTTKNTFDLSVLTKPGKYSVQVMSLGDGQKYSASDWSQIKEYVVEAEQSLEYAFYTPANKSYMVVGIGTVTSKEIVVPAFYNGFPVVCIGYKAFKDNVNITKVTLPETVKEIYGLAFYGCKSLESVVLSDGLKSIQIGAFSGSGLKSLTIPDSVYNVPGNIVDNCINLESLKLSDNIIDLGNNFFCNTPKIKSVTLPKSLRTIGRNAFTGSNIKAVIIPKTVALIYKSAFENAIIESIEFEEGSNLSIIEERAFSGCKNLKSITIPAAVKEIKEKAFLNCTNLERVVFEKNSRLKNLNSACFSNTAITEITIPKPLEVVGTYAFDGASKLETVRFEDDSELTELLGWAFRNCSNLTVVDFGKNSKVEIFASSVFENCSKLVTVSIPNTVYYLGSEAFAGCLSLKSIIIPTSVKTMSYSVFKGWTKDQIIYVEEWTELPEKWYTKWYNESNATIVLGYRQE